MTSLIYRPCQSISGDHGTAIRIFRGGFGWNPYEIWAKDDRARLGREPPSRIDSPSIDSTYWTNVSTVTSNVCHYSRSARVSKGWFFTDHHFFRRACCTTLLPAFAIETPCKAACHRGEAMLDHMLGVIPINFLYCIDYRNQDWLQIQNRSVKEHRCEFIFALNMSTK